MRELAQCAILAVDDTKTNLDLLVNTVGEHYDLSVPMDGPSALKLIEAAPPDLILLDIMMPGMDGFQVMARLQEDNRTREIPVIFLSALSEISSKAKGFAMGAVDYITKPFQIEEVFARINTHLKLRLSQEALQTFNNQLQDLVAQQVEEISHSQQAMIFALAKLSHTRDDDTGLHLERVQHLCKILTTELAAQPAWQDELTPDFIATIYHASPLHDVGKVGIADAILLKPGKLTVEEFDVMKTHTTIGAATLESVHTLYPNNSFITMGIDIARCHHERWDGSGYPLGLSGAAIPISARIMALVDVYDALRARRPYKEPFSHEKAREIIVEGKGKHFDPAIVQAFLKVDQQFEAISLSMADSAWFDRDNAETSRVAP